MNQNRHSKHFDFFSGSKVEENKDNNKFIRRAFFIFKVVFLILLAGLTLTGCVQTFVVRSDSQVGRGLEFYGNKNNVAPLAPLYTTNSPESSEGKIAENATSPQISDVAVQFLSGSNVLTSEETTIKKLRATAGATYGKNGTFTNSLALAYNSDLSGNKSKKYLQLKINEKGEGTFSNNNTDTVFKIINSNNEEKFLVYNSESTLYQPIFNSYNNIFGISRSANSYIVDQSFDVEALNQAANKNENKSTIRKFFIFRPHFYQLKMNVKPNRAALFNRDVVETLYRLLISKKLFRNIKDLRGNSQSLDQFRAWLQTQSNYTSRQIAEASASTPALNAEVAELSESQKAAFDSLVSFNLILSGSYFNQANSTTSVLEADPNAFPFFVSADSYNQQAVTSFAESWVYGPFFALVVYPIQAFTNLIFTTALGNTAFGVIVVIFLVVFLSRLVIFILSFRTIFTQQKIQELNVRKAQIEAKYAQYDKDNKIMKQRKARDMQQMYRKNGINQADTLLQIFYTTPIFLATWRIISASPIIKSNTFAGVNFASTSWQQLLNQQQWQYLPLMILALFLQIISQFLPRLLLRKRMRERTNVFERESLKKANKTQNIIIVVFAISTLLFQAGIQIYWIIGAIFTISQNLFAHYFQKSKLFKAKVKPWLDKPKLITWNQRLKT